MVMKILHQYDNNLKTTTGKNGLKFLRNGSILMSVNVLKQRQLGACECFTEIYAPPEAWVICSAINFWS